MAKLDTLFRTTCVVIVISILPLFLFLYMATVVIHESHTTIRAVDISNFSAQDLDIPNGTTGTVTELKLVNQSDLSEVLRFGSSEDTESLLEPSAFESIDENTPYENDTVTVEKKERLYPRNLNFTNIYNTSADEQFIKTKRKNVNIPQDIQDRPKNILFIVADDLRPQLNSFIHVDSLFPVDNFFMHTPNIDALAAKSLVLNRAYVQYSSCGPSRASFMTSRRPDTTKVWDLFTFWRENGGNFTTIPQFFKEKGYRTAGLGKIYHPGKGGGYNDPLSWTERFFIPPAGGYWANRSNIADFWKSVSQEERELHPLPDEEILIQSVKRLRHFAAKEIPKGNPFFLAVGFLKPHLPIVFPEEFLRLYAWTL